MRRALTWIKRIVAVAIVLLAAGIAALFAWVATGPRPADFLTPYIEQAFDSVSPGYHVKINQTSLVWDRWRHPIDIRLHGVEVLAPDGQLFSAFSEISVGLDVWMLPLGQVLPTSIVISHPALGLFQNDDRSLSLGFGQEAAAVPAAPTTTPAAAAPPPPQKSLPASAILALLLNPDRNSSLRALRYVAIHGADLNVGNSRGVFFEARDVDVEGNRRKGGSVELLAQGRIRYDDYQSSVNVRFDFDQNKPTVDGHVGFDGLAPGSLAALFSDEPLWRLLNVPMTGDADMQFSRDAQLQRLHFNVQGGGGTLRSDWLEAPLTVNAISAEGQLSNEFHDIQINRFMANLDDTVLTGDGVVSLNKNDAAVRANITAKNIAASKLHLFWPPKLSPMSRQWVVENITAGRVPEASAHINIQFGDIAKPALPKDAIDATIALEGAKIRYLPGHPEVTNVAGTVHIDGVSLTADIASGEYLKATRLSKGQLSIPDLGADNPHIIVHFEAETTAKDAVAFLKLPRVNHASRLNLNEDSIEGAAQVKAMVGFDFFAPHDAKGRALEPDIDYDIDADLKNVSQPGFLGKFDVKNGNGKLTLNNKELVFDGLAQVNGADASEASVKYLFKPENGFDTFIDVTAVAPAASLSRFGYPGAEYLTGTLGVKASVKQGDAIEQSKATLDLTNAAVSLEKLGWSKPAKEPATLDVTAQKKDGALTIPSFRLKANDVDVGGSATLNKDFTEISKLDLGKTSLGETHLQRVSFEPIDGGGFKLDVEGASVDLSGWLAPKQGQPPHFSFEHFPAVQFSADIGHVILGKGRELSGFKGTLTCDAQRCTDANIAASAGGKPVNFRILHNPKGSRQLSLHAQAAGAFLKDIGLIEGMDGGDLTVTGTYDDSGKNSTLNGRINITEHTIKQAPILAKILSLASFTGFIDMLGGNGIRFKRTVAPFTLHDDVITFTDAKSYGDAIGITMEGTVTMPEGKLNLQGTVVPSYSLNTLVGKVPLVGPALTGGEGQGVFAARYSVKGTQDKPDVSVNPLSMLTPGFLRGVFDIMDSGDKPEKNADDDADDEN